MTKLLSIFKKKKTLEERVKDIQSGNEEDRNNLIQEYMPFIKKVLSNQLKRYIEAEDEAFSIGLVAFNEAIEKYNEKKGNFLTFSSMVIKSRMIDQLRSDSRRSNEVYISQLQSDDDNDNYNYAESIMAIEGFESEIETKLDIKTLVHNMQEYGVSLKDLVNNGPKHKDTRDKAIDIGTYVFENLHLKEKFLKTKNLPTGQLMKDLNISKKVVQRSRKFIIAIILILDSDLDTLKEYISHDERREIK